MARGKGNMLITKKVLEQILREYSIGKNDFTQLEGEEHSYLHSTIVGYMLTVVPEQQDGEETGRIQVRHTNASGRIHYTDTWSKGDGGKASFLCRDTPQSIKKKPSYFYIQELERENAELKQAGRELKKAYEELLQQKECVIIAENKDTGKKKVGRPTLDEALVRQILADCDAGTPKTQIAQAYRIERKTIYNLLKRREQEGV